MQFARGVFGDLIGNAASLECLDQPRFGIVEILRSVPAQAFADAMWVKVATDRWFIERLDAQEK